MFMSYGTLLEIKDIVLPSNSKREKLRTNRLLYDGSLTRLPRCQGARPDHVRVEGSCCFPKELVSFDPGHVTRSSPIEKRI